MSKLQSAKSAIEAEIAHAKQGLAYYRSRIEVLEQTLAQLDSVMDLEGEPKSPANKSQKRGRPSTLKRQGKRSKHQRENGADNPANLPSTAGDYWLNLITDQPQSAPDILKSAINSLGFEPNDMQVRKLRQRLTSALQSLLQAKKIQDSGVRRERRFFRST